MDTIDIDWLRKQEACNDAVAWLETKKENNIERLYDLAIAEGKIAWINWAIPRLLSHRGKIQYAIFAAEEVLDIFERERPDDKGPRQAIDSAKKVIDKDTEENRKNAKVAANVASAVSKLDDASKWVSEKASEKAADAAAWTAAAAANLEDVTEWAVEVAVRSAVDANWWSIEATGLAKKEIEMKIFEYGMSLLKTQ